MPPHARARRLRESSGFTLVELLVVLGIIAVLLAIAVPSYLGFQQRAESTSAKADLRQSLPAVGAYFADQGTYVGMTTSALRTSYDAGLASALTPSSLTATSYSLTLVKGGCTATVAGPGGTIAVSGTGCT